MTELGHINIQCGLGRHILSPGQDFAEAPLPCSTMLRNRLGSQPLSLIALADFFMDLRLLDLQYRFFRNACDKCHIRCSIPFLPCGIVGLDFFRSRIVLADFLRGQIYAVFVKDLELLFGVCDMAVDMGGVNLLLDFFKKGFTFEALVFGGKKVAFVNLTLFDNPTAFSYLSVLPDDFFLGAYPLPCFVKEYTSGGYLDVSLREQLFRSLKIRWMW